MKEMNPCPKCGSTDLAFDHDVDDTHIDENGEEVPGIFIVCRNCGFQTNETVLWDEKETIVEMWNNNLVTEFDK